MATLQRWYRVGLLLVTLCLLGSGMLVQAQGPAGAGPYNVYLPLVRTAGQAARSIDVVPDTAARVSAAIGPAGGTLRATGADGTRYELSIPPDALDFTEVITLTPAARVERLPLSGGLVGAANLEPEGLELFTPAQLRITPARLPAGPLAVGFGYRGAGAQFHLRPLAGGAPLQAQEPVVTIELITIRPVGAGRGSQADIDQQQLSPPADPLDAAAQQVADPDGFTIEELRLVYQLVVRPELIKAAHDDRAADAALTLFTQWLAWVDSKGLRTQLLSEYAEGKELIRLIIAHAAAGSAERCVTQKRPEEGFRLLRLLRHARFYLGGAEERAIEAKLRGCLTFRVELHTWITEDAGHWAWKHVLHSESFELRWQSGMRATGSGVLSYDAVQWIGDPIDDCEFSGFGAGSTIDAASEPFGLTITPVSRTSPAVSMAFSYDPGTPVETKSIRCASAPGGSGTRTHWRDFYAQMHAYERHGSGFQAQATIVDAGSFTGWVYNHTGFGSEGPLQEETMIEIEHTPQS